METRDYIGPFQYLNNALFEIGNEEGRYSPASGYEYFHKDHLGNVRVVFGSSGISQYTDYDPWGPYLLINPKWRQPYESRQVQWQRGHQRIGLRRTVL